MAIVGLLLLWFSPYTGVLIILVGLGIAWSTEDQKIRKRNEKKLYEEENEREFNRLKFDDPVSPKILELSTLLYGTIKPHEAWLSAQLDDLEELYSNDSIEAIQETQDISNGKFKNLFSTCEAYQSICLFLKREISIEIVEDIEKTIFENEVDGSDSANQSSHIPNLNEILADYDLEEWAKKVIKTKLDTGKDRNTIIKEVSLEGRKELNKNISVSCLHDEWIINGRIKFMI